MRGPTMVASFKCLFQGRVALRNFRKGTVPWPSVLTCLSPPSSGDGEGRSVSLGVLRASPLGQSAFSWDSDPMTRPSGGGLVMDFFFLLRGN